jgi:PAS domain S-box-containing protein
VSWNTGAQRLKGYSASEVIGRHFSLFYTPEDVAVGLPGRALLRAMGPDGFWSEDGWRMRKDGTRFMASVSISALRDSDGAMRGFAKITRVRRD